MEANANVLAHPCISSTKDAPCPARAALPVVTAVSDTGSASDPLVRRQSEELVRHFVASSPSMTWCPNPKCDAAILAPRGSTQLASCGVCSLSFCDKCDYPRHYPVSCEDMVEWEKLGGYVDSSDEQKGTRALLANLTPCPSCRVRIEKNEGCNHVR